MFGFSWSGHRFGRNPLKKDTVTLTADERLPDSTVLTVAADGTLSLNNRETVLQLNLAGRKLVDFDGPPLGPVETIGVELHESQRELLKARREADARCRGGVVSEERGEEELQFVRQLPASGAAAHRYRARAGALARGQPAIY